MPQMGTPAISFFCICRKRLYAISTNVLAIHGKFQCQRCGRHYVCLDSLIAVSAVSARDARERLSTMGATRPTSHTRLQRV